MRKLYFFILTLFICVTIFSCVKNNDKEKVFIKHIKEIEENNTYEYAQFIDSNVEIKGSVVNKIKDIDYYKLAPTNGWIFSLDIEYDRNSQLCFEILDREEVTILKLKTSDFEKGVSKIKLPYFIFDDSFYYLKVFSENAYSFDGIEEKKYDENIKYELTINYTKGYIEYDKVIPAHRFENAIEILSPETRHKGSFIKTSDYKDMSNILTNYININTLVDIDIYKIENTLGQNSSITVNLEYIKQNAKIILFDERYNFITSSSKKVTAYFPPDTKIYAVVFLEDSKSSGDNYYIYYTIE